MSGFLSGVFDPGDSGNASNASGDGGQVASEDGYSESGDTLDQSASAEAGAGLEVTVPLHLQAGFEYQTEDGSGGWNNSTDATLTVSTAALLGATGESSFTDESESS